MARLHRISMLAALFVACDPTAATEVVVDEAAQRVQEVSDAQEQAERAAERKLLACIAECSEGSTRDPTDHATCRLLCERGADTAGVHEPPDTPAAILMTFDRCASACERKPDRGDAATCRLQCTQTSAAASTRTRGCVSECLETYVGCSAACQGPSDDASTCALHCETHLERCLSPCEPAT
jgi:hypothetical protein